MSLQYALQTAQIEKMLKQQRELLERYEGVVESEVVKQLRISESEIEHVLSYGGVSSVKVEIQGKVKNFKVSVKTKNSNNIPEFKFHVKTALGHTLYIQAKDRLTAQLVVNKLFGKGQYVVSAALY